MKIPGGYLPRIAGRPSSVVMDVALPERLVIDCQRRGLRYTPAVRKDEVIQSGQALAHATMPGGRLSLPAPAGGCVESVNEERITLTDLQEGPASDDSERHGPERISAERIRTDLSAAGIWPFFWSSVTGAPPPLDGSDQPRHIIVNCLSAEPFRARGKIVLRQDWDHIVKGLRFLPRLLDEYGIVHLVLTHAADPVAKMMKRDLTGHARLHFHEVPLVYPIENPVVVSRALRQSLPVERRQDSIWVTNVHAMRAVGACLSHGTSLHKCLVAIGGPGISNPRHVRAYIGTPIADLFGDELPDPAAALLLRGGLLTGEPISSPSDPISYDDDAFFLLPRPGEREFLSFVRAGFDRTSALPCFASRLTRSFDQRISTLLRGERRPCIACGLCEKVCPVRLLPQVIHRYLYRDAISEAEASGLATCAECGLCSFVCPSKIELTHQFRMAKEQLEHEHREAAAAEDARQRREQAKEQEKEHSEDWRK